MHICFTLTHKVALKNTPGARDYVTRLSNASTKHRAGGNNTTTARLTLQCNITKPNTTQPPSTSTFTDCQGHFVMLCRNAAGHDCPSLSLLLPLLDLTNRATVCYSKKHVIVPSRIIYSLVC